ncbi:MAG: ASPIC/UnbV domain-containing protein [Planctomycetota bacterium]|nr:ASPIC/UnbV domain-containing protein [Planctomycetota bacterium]
MVASTVDTESEESIAAAEQPNADSYLNFHSSQMFTDGFSFSGFERNKVFVGRGDGSFADLSDVSGADTPNDSRGAVWADFDDDGDADVFVHNLQRERHDLYRNDIAVPGEKGAGFLKVRLRATSGQYEAIGATVTVTGPWGSTSQVLSRGGGFNSCQPPELIFGLGQAATGSVSVLWPGGLRQEFGAQDSGARLMLVEGQAEPGSFERIPRTLRDPQPPGLKVDVGDLIGKLAFADATGADKSIDPVALASDGKPVLLNLWASYCPGCVAELPLLAKKAKAGEAHVVLLSMDSPGQIPAAEGLLDRQDAPFHRLYLPEGTRTTGPGEVTTEDLFDLARLPIPTTLVLDQEGRVGTIIRGQIREE